LVKRKEFPAALYVPVLLSLAVLSHHLIRTFRYDLSTWKGGGMGMFSTQDDHDTRFVSIWLETEAGEFVAARRNIGKPLGHYVAEPTTSNLQALCRHLGKVVWIDARQSKTPIHTTESAEPVPVAMVQRVASAAGEPLIPRCIRVTGFKLVVDVASGELHHQTLGTLNCAASGDGRS